MQCIIPYRVKSKSHIHLLTIEVCFVEDNSGENYCDICEEERESKDVVYCCQECQLLFVAHIQCALASQGKYTFWHPICIELAFPLFLQVFMDIKA